MLRVSPSFRKSRYGAPSPKFVSPRNLSIPEIVKQPYDRRVEEMTPYFQHCNYGAWEA